ncbi:13342_t:CDS:2 [Ambispora gerdemannii]|uniref:13342_t:CDS:1 n=1 Tax=Ambispora gerdemannii TaxID=144530 RepID=A0A9N8V5Q5_9GLOM|nr:13342_t:CDS:2 [Ambispora gerdemannii]
MPSMVHLTTLVSAELPNKISSLENLGGVDNNIFLTSSTFARMLSFAMFHESNGKISPPSTFFHT